MITLNRGLVVVLTYCGVMGAVIYMKGRHPASSSAPPIATITDTTAVHGGRFLTPHGRPYGLTIFTDYQCPSCAAFERALAALSPRLRDSLTIAVRHLPLERIHPAALSAAIAADCAGRQGHFAAMHHQLFAKQDAIGVMPFRDYALRVQVPQLAAFDACVSGRATLDGIRADVAIARRLGFSATPVIVIGKVRITGAPSPTLLDSLVRRHGSR